MSTRNEAMKLAMKGMQAQDRKLFKLVMKGVDQAEIARRLGVSRQRIGQRLNGVLWELRSRADLAEYLGVKPESPPAGMNRQNLPSPAKFPAQLAG
jgi:DNA-directed RNA polymerase specialized sigma24 family protein